MSKYDDIPLKHHKARVHHKCYSCDRMIQKGEIVYYQDDKFLQSLSRKKFCVECFNKNAQKLLLIKKKKTNKDQRTLFQN